MTALLKIVPDVIKLPVAALLGALIAFYPATWYGASQEKNRAQVAILEKTIEVIRDRQATDAEVAASSPTDVCRFMGLPEQDYLECVRRVAEANPVAEHLGGGNPLGPPVCEPSRNTQRLRG